MLDSVGMVYRCKLSVRSFYERPAVSCGWRLMGRSKWIVPFSVVITSWSGKSEDGRVCVCCVCLFIEGLEPTRSTVNDILHVLVLPTIYSFVKEEQRFAWKCFLTLFI